MRQSRAEEQLVAAAIKYVRKRNGVYLYERRVPLEVQRHEAHYAIHFGSRPLFRRSLRTKSDMEMMVACLPVHREFERKIAATKGGAEAPPAADQSILSQTRRKVTQADLMALSDRYRQLELQPVERAHMMADASPEHAKEYERIIYNLELDAEDTARAIANRGAGNGTFETPAEIAVWVIENENWDAPAGSKTFGAVVGAIRAGIQHGRYDIDALASGNSIPRLETKGEERTVRVPKISDATERYIVQRNLPPRTEGEVRSSLALFIQQVGDVGLDAISRRHFQSYAEHLAQQTVGGKSSGSISRLASKATVKKRVGLLRAVINHAIARDDFSGPNPASGVNVDAYVARPNRAVMPAKRRFTVNEMALIFKQPWFTGCASTTLTHASGTHRLGGSEYWVPVVAALTGCRASELGGLMLSEVRLESATPHLVIRDNVYRRTKGGYSRKVPVIDELLALRFADYVGSVRARGTDRLFPDWQAPKGRNTERNDDKAWSNGKVIRAFNRTVVPAALAGQLAPGARQEVTFHSFRGAFKAMLGSSAYKLHPNIINEVLGHSKSQMDAVYVGEMPIEETYPAIRSCRYDGLIMPVPPFT